MITIQSGKMMIPEEERFVGFAGDDRSSTKQFILPQTQITDIDAVFSLYLRFDDDRVTSAPLTVSIIDSDTILTWNIRAENLLKSGIVMAQIKYTDGNGRVIHYSWDYFVVGESAERGDDGEECDILSRSEFEERMAQAVRDARATAPYIGDDGYWYIYKREAGDYVRSFSASGITVDSAISDSSVNPIENRAVKAYVDARDSTKVDKTASIAGVALNSGITAADLYEGLAGTINPPMVTIGATHGYPAQYGKTFEGTPVFCTGLNTWVELAKAGDVPVKISDLINDSGMMQPQVVISAGNCSDYSNANDFAPNRVYGISSSVTEQMVSNLPKYGVWGYLMYYTPHPTQKRGIQIYRCKTESWYRQLENDGTGTWVRLAHIEDMLKTVQPSNVIISYNNWQDYSDANNLTPNRTYGISSRIKSAVPQGEDPDPTYGYVDNLPAYNRTAALTFIGVSKTGKTGYQVYYSEYDVWFRKTDADGAGTWKCILKAPPTARGLRKYDVLCFGDSLTAGSGCTIPYHYYESLFGSHICHNFGIGGTGYIKEKGSASEPKSDYKGTGQVGKPDSTVEMTGGNNVLAYFKENEASITSSTAIVIFAGTNDYGAQYGLDTFETALRSTYTYILGHFTQPLIVCTPMNRVARDGEAVTLEQYVDKIIAVCTEMKIPVIDFFHNVQLRPNVSTWRRVYYYDNIHPNDTGHQLIGAYFGAKLNEYLGC